MEAVAVCKELFLVPPGTRETVWAQDQPEYLPLPSLTTPTGIVVSQWRPTPEELHKLNIGESITLLVYTHNTPLQPIFLGVGGYDLR